MMGKYDIRISIVNDTHAKQPFRLIKTDNECKKLSDALSSHLRHDVGEKLVVTCPNLQECISHCLNDPEIVRCDWFRDFLSSSPTVEYTNIDQLSITDPLSIAIEFLLQPFDSEVVYIPRRKCFFIDYTVRAGDVLVWRFSGGATTALAFTARFQSNNGSVMLANELGGNFNGDVVEVVECNSNKGSSGTFRAPKAGVVRLTFDNTTSLFRGNFLEYCVQCVSIETMLAAETAAADQAHASMHTSALVVAVQQCTSDDSFEVVVVEYNEEDLINASEQNQVEHVEDTVARHSSWVAYAGELVTATVAGISGISSRSTPKLEKAVDGRRRDIGDNEARITEIQQSLKSCPSDLCTVCGSGSVKDMLYLAKKIDAMKDEMCLERALAEQASVAAATAAKVLLHEKTDLIDKLSNEYSHLQQKCCQFEELQTKHLVAESAQRAEINILKNDNVNLTERLEKVQKEAGVWNVARGKVEEELYFLSDIREKESAERLAVLSQCSELQVERNELLQRIADLEHQQLLASSHDSPDDTKPKSKQEEVLLKHSINDLQAEITKLQAQRSIDDKKIAMLQSEFQEYITSTQSKLSESKMLQYHYKEKLNRIKTEKKALVAELRILRDKGVYTSGGGSGGGDKRSEPVPCVHSSDDLGLEGVEKDIERNFCTEKLSELMERKEIVDLTLDMGVDSQTLQELSAQLCDETNVIRSHGEV